MSETNRLIIRQLRPSDRHQAEALHEQLLADEFEFLVGRGERESFADYVARQLANEEGRDIPEGWVRAGFYVAERDGELLGRLGVRYELNAFLASVAGHLGYGVGPAYRRQGVAEALARFGLQRLHASGVDQALITCDEANTGSRATIEKVGGRLDRQQPTVRRHDGGTTLRFWAPTG
ncbi:hypothetical protein GCM10027417_03950 [Glutamicibacter endophyticus]